MVDVAAVTAGLSAAGLAFGPPAATPATLRWGPLFDALDGDGDDDYVTAVELIYEGYLFHYRESRVSETPAAARETTLLAGDFFYARGLRIIAARSGFWRASWPPVRICAASAANGAPTLRRCEQAAMRRARSPTASASPRGRTRWAVWRRCAGGPRRR